MLKRMQRNTLSHWLLWPSVDRMFHGIDELFQEWLILLASVLQVKAKVQQWHTLQYLRSWSASTCTAGGASRNVGLSITEKPIALLPPVQKDTNVCVTSPRLKNTELNCLPCVFLGVGGQRVIQMLSGSIQEYCISSYLSWLTALWLGSGLNVAIIAYSPT